MGASHACALTEDREAVCWDIASATVWDTPLGTYTYIKAVGFDACAVTDKSEIVCWSQGGGPIDRYEYNPSRDAPPGLYKALAWIRDYSCALTEDGEAVCWHGEYLWPVPPDPPPGRYVSISVGSYFPGLGGAFTTACALAEDGEIVCWGGQNSDPPQSVGRSGSEHKAVSVHGWGFCGLTVDGEITGTCIGLLDDTRAPYAAIDAGRGGHVCVITDAGALSCGSDALNYYDGRQLVMNAPGSAGPYVALSVGDDAACALREDGRADCWVAVVNLVSPPDPASGPYQALSAGSGHTCALTHHGSVVCWGWNNFGQLDLPPGRYTAISARELSTCALTEEGEVVCAGLEQEWEEPRGPDDWCGLVDGREAGCSDDRTTWPADLPADDIVAVSSGYHYYCALSRTGEVQCWGTFDNRKDDPDFGPVEPPPGGYRAIASGSHRACALTDEGQLVCWGDTEYKAWPPQYAPY